MKKDLLDKYFNVIKEKTNGDNTSDWNIIDYENGTTIDKTQIENEYYKYLGLQEEIDDYVEENDLDDVFDRDKIVEYFSKKIDENCFMFNQAVLKDFTDYLATIINNKNEKIRKANMIFNKNGNGFDTTKITIPVNWARQLGFTPDDKEGILLLEDNQIILRKN